MFSKTDLAIVFAVVIGALCVALYQAWIQPIQAIVALVILVVATIGLTVFGWSRDKHLEIEKHYEHGGKDERCPSRGR
jgi:hypothetical protein